MLYWLSVAARMLNDARFFDAGKVIMLFVIKYSVFLSEGLIKLKSGAENFDTPWRLLGIWIPGVSTRVSIKITGYARVKIHGHIMAKGWGQCLLLFMCLNLILWFN